MKQRANEAVIHPDTEEVERVVSALLGDMPPEEAKAQLAQSKTKVGYGPKNIMRTVPAVGGVTGSGEVHINPPYAKNRPVLKYALPHEFIHREQVKRMGPKGQKFVDDLVDDLLAGGVLDPAKYGEVPQEQMAWAHTIVDEMRRRGMNQEQILQALRSGSIGQASAIFQSPNALKRLLWYAYHYAKVE